MLLSLQIQSSLSQFNLHQNISLAKYTTWKVGGLASYLIEVKSNSDLLQILKIIAKNKIDFIILGRGSNVLISDKGLDKLVLINKADQNPEAFSVEKIATSDNNPSHSQFLEYLKNFSPNQIPVWFSHTKDKNYYSFQDLEFQEEGDKKIINFSAGQFLPLAIKWTLTQNLTGLHWFSGIPGSIGGSLFNNIHSGTKHLSDYFAFAKVFIPKTDTEAYQKIQKLDQKGLNLILEKDKDWIVALADIEFLDLGYDQSFLRRKNNQVIVLEVYLSLFKTENQEILQKAKQTSLEWTKRKRIQPKNSAGSTFKAISNENKQKFDFPTNSAGYIIEHVLNLKGKQIGESMISKVHANFIETNTKSKAAEVYELIQLVQKTCQEKLGIDLETEVNLLGEF